MRFALVLFGRVRVRSAASCMYFIFERIFLNPICFDYVLLKIVNDRPFELVSLVDICTLSNFTTMTVLLEDLMVLDAMYFWCKRYWALVVFICFHSL